MSEYAEFFELAKKTTAYWRTVPTPEHHAIDYAEPIERHRDSIEALQGAVLECIRTYNSKWPSTTLQDIVKPRITVDQSEDEPVVPRPIDEHMIYEIQGPSIPAFARTPLTNGELSVKLENSQNEIEELMNKFTFDIQPSLEVQPPHLPTKLAELDSFLLKLLKCAYTFSTIHSEWNLYAYSRREQASVLYERIQTLITQLTSGHDNDNKSGYDNKSVTKNTGPHIGQPESLDSFLADIQDMKPLIREYAPYIDPQRARSRSGQVESASSVSQLQVTEVVETDPKCTHWKQLRISFADHTRV
jgi:hypothetical protein